MARENAEAVAKEKFSLLDGTNLFFGFLSLIATIFLGLIGLYLTIKTMEGGERDSRERLAATFLPLLITGDEATQSAASEALVPLIDPKSDETNRSLLVEVFDRFLLSAFHFDVNPKKASLVQALRDALREKKSAGLKALEPSAGPAPMVSAPQSRAPASIEPKPATTAAMAPSNVLAENLLNALPTSTWRLFIHIADKAQRPGAAEIASRLNAPGAEFKVLVPGIENVADRGPDSAELRVLKCADVEPAKALQAQLSKLVGLHIELKSICAKYDTAPDVRPRTLELWFGKNDVLPAPKS